MKVLIFLTLAIFSVFSMAGVINTGSFSSKTVSHGYSDTTGKSISTQTGSGTAVYGELLNGRIDTYTRDDETITKFDGHSHTSKVTKTNGTNNGINGSSVSVTKGSTDGYMDSVVKTNNLVAGTYEQFTYDDNGYNYESGSFSEAYNQKDVAYEDYTTDFKAESTSAYTVY